MLELSNVSTSYGPVAMLRGVSMTIGKGELVCLLGPNGAGKSTTFKALTGLLPLDGGAVRMMGRDIARLGTEKLAALGVGFVPEGRRLFPTLTVRENLKLGYDASGCAIPFETRLELIHDMFPRIRERMNQQANTMSGGEQAMVALARALIGDPEMLVMDEPSLGLSPKLIDEYFETVVRIHAEGKTVLLIEQNAETALSISDRGYLLVRGRIAVSGTRAEMLRDDTIRHMYL
ncbi:ABC transporter ATP-binding protein (plasmid) [Paracoccus versutus]|uniref:Branched-chain amino acid transport system ATP-binding protein n=1 Tax=Paracoccus versutus TaxID=34007 RepID=A0AAQ0HKS8_PARVE|nr:MULTISPECIES: ABC transporter ATP-binding protein [Paracoccus]SFX35046.1 amino acid/amide ABC transporter ATP-binding protein 2, HAAT family (TC 3.A.1.4.-) [Paracoccus pantotrophus]KGJ10614.1 ABC transporter ATP-binding protein [Paracoccus versutus]MCJ1899187.1 ABC transporter ATP-binding protein [Paracoccus versutus]MDF3904171.1 ABC transporter ATP-binding protein [Paracoccus sp. AS002]REG54309.1 branched-chain amino acid transport system ATP-binding protein [Paracoccus versutus]